MAKETKIIISEKEQAILNALSNADHALTLEEISNACGMKLVAGNINALLTRKGKVVKGEDAEVPCMKKRTVATYCFTGDIAKDAKITDTEKAIIEAAATVTEDGDPIFYTLEDISQMVGKKLSSGNIIGLIHKGAIAKGDNKVVEYESTKKVGTYQLAE